MQNYVSENNSLNTQNYIDLVYDESWETMGMSDIIETTFTYLHGKDLSEKIENNLKISYEEYTNEIHFNEHYFSKIGGIDFSTWINKNPESRNKELYIAKQQVENQFTTKIEQIVSIENELNNQLQILRQQLAELDETSSEYLQLENNCIKLDMFIRSIDETKIKLEQALISVVFEAEKAGLQHDLSEDEVRDLCSTLDEYDEKIHGGSIKNDPEHMERCYRVMKTQYNEYLESNEQLPCVNQILENIINRLPQDYQFTQYDLPIKSTLDFTDKTLPIQYIVEDFNAFCKASQMDYKAVLANVGSVTNADTCLKIPESETEMSNERFNRLTGHELVCHTTTLLNGNKILGFKGADYIQKEEGLAVLKELLYVYGKGMYNINSDGNISIDKNKVDIMNDPRMLAGELLSGKDLYIFLEKYHQVKQDRCHFSARFDRLKRGRLFHIPGTQKKDRGYITGLMKTIDFVNRGGNIHDLELAKHGFDDLENVKKIYTNMCKLSEEPDLIKIHGLDEFIYFRKARKEIKRSYNLTDKSISFQEYCDRENLTEYSGAFKDFFQDKYPMFDINSDSLINIPVNVEMSSDIMKQVASILIRKEQ